MLLSYLFVYIQLYLGIKPVMFKFHFAEVTILTMPSIKKYILSTFCTQIK